VKIIHISDPHFSTPGKPVCGLDPRQRMDYCISDINAHHSDADLCVITGDLTDNGERKAYEHLAECLTKLNVPVKMMLGNHDSRATFLETFPDEPTDRFGFVQESRVMPDGYLLFLDTNEPNMASGHYCSRRREWLSNKLAQAGDAPVYLFMHHPPFPTHIQGLDDIGLADSPEFGETVAGYRTIRHLFLGHLHRPMAGSWRDIPYTCVKAVNHQSALDFRPGQELMGSHEPPHYAVAFIDPDSVVVHFHDYLDDSDRFPLG